MPKVIQAAEFFVIGGPVQPDRPCYVERAADLMLESAIRERHFCCVLAPPASGKSTLMSRVARNLRRVGHLTAIVDLTQVGARGASGDADRWTFGIAYRVAHELRLKVDLAGWWREKTALVGEQRLIDFFWEIVLTNTTSAITIFVDDIEQTLELPFAQELFSAIHACYARRKSEPDFGRLNFVVLGVMSLRQLAGDDRLSRFVDARSIPSSDFTAEESYQLAVGFGGESIQAQALMDRVCAWTGGHPYLTQKVARGVAHKGGKLEDVERVVREQLLAPSAAQNEPLLTHAWALLTARSTRARRAMKVLRKLGRSAKVKAPADLAVLELLQLSGVVVVDAARELHYRNRIFKEVFGRWLRESSPRWLAWAAAATLVVGAALGGYWYTQYLPVAYVATLSSETAELAAVQDAYQQLHDLPGFAERAEQLLAAELTRRAGAATTLAAVVAATTQLRALPGQNELADRLLAEFWLRRAELAMGSEQRDAALLLALRAAEIDTPLSAVGAGFVNELLSDDYAQLERTLRLSAAPTYWRMNWQAGTLLTLDADQQVQRVAFGAAAGGGALGTAPVRLSALRHTPLTRELIVEGDGSAGEFELSLAVQHPAGGELFVTLAAPNGEQAIVLVPRGNADQLETYIFPAAEGSSLAALADSPRRGTWRLTVVDRRVENAGSFGGWVLRFGEDESRDAPEFTIDIPEPARTEAVSVAVAGDYALVQPSQPGAIGTVALWDLAAGRLHNDFTMVAVPQHAAINANSSRLLAAAANVVTLWNVADGMPVARLATQTEFVLPPVFSADGGYLAIAESVEGAQPLYSLLGAADGSLLASIEGVEAAQSWLLGPGARYLALQGPAEVVRVLDPRRGGELHRLLHERAVQRLLPSPDGVSVVTVDSVGEIRVWPLGAEGAARGNVPRSLGTAADPTSVTLSADGARLSYTAYDGEVLVLDVASGGRLASLRTPRAAGMQDVQLAPDGARLVTRSSERFRLWTLPAPGSRPAAASTDLTALALDPDAQLVAVGLRAGQLRVSAPADLAQAGVATAALDFFGHRGAIEHVVLNVAGGIAASGGRDGSVRLWDLATVAPGESVLQHPDGGRVVALALSNDGRLVASAADTSVRVAVVADGAVAAQFPSSAPVSAVAFAPDGGRIAIGARSGALVIAPVVGSLQPASTDLDSAILSIAFARSGEYLAVGDAAGYVHLLRAADGSAAGAAATLPQPARAIRFNVDGSVLFAATDYWLHSFAVAESGLTPLHSRLAPRRFAPGVAIAPAAGEQLRVAGYDGRGELGVTALDLAVSPDAALAGEFRARVGDWPAALGLRLDDAGEPALFDP
jgi:WD40 repeat protein